MDKSMCTRVLEHIRKTMPELAKSLPPDKVFEEQLNDPLVAPFLQWFIENVTSQNVLTKDEAAFKRHLEQNNLRMSTEALDAALAEQTKDCPELMNLVSSDYHMPEKVNERYLQAKANYEEQARYTSELEKIHAKLSARKEDLNDENKRLDFTVNRKTSELDKLYRVVNDLAEKLDESLKKLHIDVRELVQVYSLASQKSFPKVVWTQLPMERFVEKMEFYYDFLEKYTKKHFEYISDTSSYESDYSTMSERDKQSEEQRKELESLQKKLKSSKLNEALTDIDRESTEAMHTFIEELMRSGNSMIPQTEAQMQAEMLRLSNERDTLESEVMMLKEQELREAVKELVKMDLTEILVKNARLRVERREGKLEKLQQLQTLVKRKGHAYSDLICLLMELQSVKLHEIFEFVNDVQHYLTTEYSLSAKRRSLMEQAQQDFLTAKRAPSRILNPFNEAIVSLMNGDKEETVSMSLDKYNILVDTNKLLAEKILGKRDFSNVVLKNTDVMETKLMKLFDVEANNGPTIKFQVIPPEIEDKLHSSCTKLLAVQKNMRKIREATKRKLNAPNDESSQLKRATELLWQNFLVDPDKMISTYDEAERKVNKGMFNIK